MADQEHTPSRASANVPTKTKLTDAFIRALKPPAKGGRLVVWDETEPGLAIRIYDSGKRSFVVVKRLRNGPPIRYTVKPGYPGTSLQQAREKAVEVKRLLANGINPLEQERAADRAREQAKAEAKDTSFATVCEAFIARKVVGSNPSRPLLRSANEMAQNIRRDLCGAAFARKPVSAITRENIIDMIASMVKDPSRRRRTEAGDWSQVAFRSFNLTRQVMAWAMKRPEYKLMSNPCDRVDVAEEIGSTKPAARNRILSDREIRLVWRAADRMAYPAGCLLKLLILTCARRSEIAELEHVEISTVERADFSGAVIVVAAERMKSRNGKAREHAIPITGAMADVLETVPVFATPGKYVLSYSGGRRPMGSFDSVKRQVDSIVLDLLRAELDLPADAEVPAELVPPKWVIHDIRRTGRSLLSRLGVNADDAEAVLAHRVGGVRGVYDVYDRLPEKAAALRALSDEISKIVGTNVVSLPRKTA